MTATRVFTDEELTAYLDGELDASTRHQIATALESDTALRQRLKTMDYRVDAMKDAFGALLSAAPDLPALPEPSKWKNAVALPKAMMAMAACLVLGAMIGTGIARFSEQPRDWRGYVAAYHSLYVNGTLVGADIPSQETEAMLANLGALLGHDLAPAQTDTVLQYRRGQILGYQGQPLVQLAFLTPTGEPIALCIIHAADAPDSAVTPIELEGMAAAQWERDGLAFLLIGGADAALIKDAADRFSAKL